MLLDIGKHCHIEGDLTRDDDPVGNEIKTAVSFVVSRVVKKDAKSRTWSEFVASCDGEVGVTLAFKDVKMSI